MENKFLDREGVKVLYKELSLQDYPNNETLIAVIDAIDETKLDKNDHSWDNLKNRPFGEGATSIAKTILDTTMSSEEMFPMEDENGNIERYSFSREDYNKYYKSGSTFDIILDDVIYENVPLQDYALEDPVTGEFITSQMFGDFNLIEYPFWIDIMLQEEEISTYVTIVPVLECKIQLNNNNYTSLTILAQEPATGLLDEKYIPDTIARVEDIPTKTSELDNDSGYLTEQIQSDWNQNDETAVDYIKNRPFYEEIGEEIIIEQNIPSSSFSVNNGMYVANVAGTKVFSETGTYNIVYDGTLYSNVAVSKMGMNIIILGNIDESDMPVFTTYPFAIMLVRTNNIITIITNDTELTSHDVKIVEVVEIIHELDEKYIPYVTGKKVEGQTFNISGEDIVAGKGAEIFNNYEGNVATGTYSHAEGYNTLASEDYSHSQNAGTKATAFASHAEGETTVASGRGSHSEGRYTIASVDYQHVQGKYNVEDAENKYAHIVGNGTYKQRSNAHTLDWNGNAWFAGDVYVGGTSQDDGKKLATVLTEDDALAIVFEMGLVEPVLADDGSIYTDENNAVYIL